MSTPKPYHCRHLFTDGHQCGSPALRGELLCYYHHAARRPAQLRTIGGHPLIAFPEPTDLHAVQRGLCELLRLAATGTVDPPQARTLLRILATASANLARIDRQAAAAHKADPARTPVQDYVLDPQCGTIAPAPDGQPTPEPHPEGPLPDPVAPLTLQPTIELVRDPIIEELNTLRFDKAVRDMNDKTAAEKTSRQASSRKFLERATRHGLLPPAQTYPIQNEDFGLLETPHPKPHQEHLIQA